MPNRREAELEAEIIRLREAMASMESRAGPSSNDMGIAGRVAISRMRDTDYPELVAAVDRLPGIYREAGRMAAIAYARTHIRALLFSIIFSNPRTADLARIQHRMMSMLSEGQVEVMFRSDTAGVRARTDFLEVVVIHAFAPSVRAAFAHGTETPPGLIQTNPGRG